MEKIKILILSANPKDTDRLRLDQEKREIKEALKLAQKRERFEIVSTDAVRVDDLRRALLEYTPRIVHFSGHGAGTNGIALEDNAGKMKLVSTQSLTRLFKLFSDSLECVFFNACYSEVQAEAIHQHIPYVVGMNKAIGDRAAIEFAKGFYDSLGAGKSYEFAYEMGCIAIDLDSIPESDTPVLKVKDGTPLPPSPPDDTSKPEPIPPDELEIPEGRVPLNSPLYVERPPIEVDCCEDILRPGALIRVKAPRQMGKSSLMSRILDAARQKDCQTAELSFQTADSVFLKDLDLFLKWFCANITNAVRLPDKIDSYWQGSFLGAKTKCTNYFFQYLLNELKTPLVLGLDEVDEVFKHPEVAGEFFGLLRAWHEAAKNDGTWQKLRLVITHSKEVYIPLNINQSPFNVGVAIELPMLNFNQVKDLALVHDLNWSDAQIEELMLLLGGHPFLVRTAFYQIAKSRMTFERLKQIAPTEEGPFVDHLGRHRLNLEEDPALLAAAKKVFENPDSAEVGATEAFKLRSMGIVKVIENEVKPLCDLYYQYFHKRLGV